MTHARTVRRARARRGRRTAIVAVTVAAVAGAGGISWAVTRSNGPRYRLASVTRATVQQSVTTTGSVSTTRQASPAFSIGGTVASVPVRVGRAVKAGATLATLDRSSLDQAVQSAQATVASAKQTLATDQSAQLDAATLSSTTTGSSFSDPAPTAATTASSTFPSQRATSGPTPTATPSPTAAAPSPGSTRTSQPGAASSSSAALTSDIAAVLKAQAQVIAEQHSVDLDSDVAAADKAVVAERATCQAILGRTTAPSLSAPSSAASSPSTPAGTATSLASSDPAPAPSTSSQSSVSGDLASCQSAIDAVQQAQATVQSDVDTLTADETALDHAVSALLQTLRNSPTGESSSHPSATPTGRSHSRPATGPVESHASGSAALPSTGAPRSGSGRSSTGDLGSGGSGTGGSGTGSGGTDRVITAAQLAADQKAIDAADAELAVAKQNTALATLTAPISGRVAAVGLSVGQNVSAGSSTATVTILGGGQKSVETAVGIGNLALVKVGTPATVTVTGVSKPLLGKVTYIGVMNTTGTSGATSTYPVTVLLDATRASFYDGAQASVALHVGSATDALTVPTSAIHRLGGLDTVELYSHGTVTATRVTVGVPGAARTQILSGLKLGQQVVLATISAPVPGTSSGNQRLTSRLGGTGGIGGGLGGGGLGGGGLGGGGRPGG